MGRDPWEEIDPPSIADSVAARRVDANLPWNFYWARGMDGKILLTLRHAADSAPTAQLPRLRDIEVTLSPPDGSRTQLLALRLLDSNHRDIFHTLCQDIISAATRAYSEAEAVSVALTRIWRWHHLLRGGRSSLLSPEEQKGLIGELLVLERVLLPRMDASSALSAWRGPLGAPKDFEISRVAIEAKTRRGGATPFLSINSENQLDDSGVESLFLHVVELDRAPLDKNQGITVNDVVERILDRLLSLDPRSSDIFETLLAAAGYRMEDDYTNYLWLEGATRVYQVSGSFPRITSGEIRSGVSSVRYSVSLDDCEPFATTIGALDKALSGR